MPRIAPFYSGPALGVSAGRPGEWTPPRATPPSLAELNTTGIVAFPMTAWLAGHYAPNAATGAVYWNGTAYVVYTATAGTPGSYNVAGFAPQSSTTLRDMGVVASPNTTWTTGQRVTTADGQNAHWNGSAWIQGAKP